MFVRGFLIGNIVFWPIGNSAQSKIKMDENELFSLWNCVLVSFITSKEAIQLYNTLITHE